MEIQEKLSIDRCRKLIKNGSIFSDDEILDIRDTFYKLARVVVDKFERLKSFFTQTQTIAAKARIVQ